MFKNKWNYNLFNQKQKSINHLFVIVKLSFSKQIELPKKQKKKNIYKLLRSPYLRVELS